MVVQPLDQAAQPGPHHLAGLLRDGPASVRATGRRRRSSPAMRAVRSTQPARSSDCTMRVAVLTATPVAAATSDTASGPPARLSRVTC